MDTTGYIHFIEHISKPPELIKLIKLILAINVRNIE
jgi:hypothetical protein